MEEIYFYFMCLITLDCQLYAWTHWAHAGDRVWMALTLVRTNVLSPFPFWTWDLRWVDDVFIQGLQLEALSEVHVSRCGQQM